MEEIEVVYEDGVFKPLKRIKLKDGTKGVVIIKLPKRISEIAEKYRIKVKKDVLKEFLEERR
ncbi:antitoxin AF2212-like protein [Thermococcus sp. SY098]|uniref:antitoxin AF2212-like protein n=1 Tax=Thermococcus sp. SY098 TaxID=3111325 RepID=UPI002D782BCB|nr:antitoxin AF2212-like protein [Thermococcus sp. SY098]WRS52152.1 antitoxin AF2212-like protein [Thermococcus sp. SY098]